MTLDSAIGYFRTREVDLMRDTCTIVRPIGDPEFDDDTEDVTQATEDIYAGACTVRPADRVGSDVTAGERDVRVGSWMVKLPIDTDAQIDDLVTVTASTYDAGLVDKTFRVTDVMFDGYQITRKAAIEIVTGFTAPEEVGS